MDGLWGTATNQSTPGRAQHVCSLSAHARWFTGHHSNMPCPHIHHHLAEVAKALPGSSSQGTKHWWVQVLFLSGVETFGIYWTEERSIAPRCPQGCLYLQGRAHSPASIAPAVPDSLLTSLVDVLFKPTQISCDFTIQPGDKWGLAGYIQKG